MLALMHALQMAFQMGWEIFWALVLGLGLSAIVQALVPKGHMSKLLPDSSPKSLAIACGLGAASSSCSYAAVALTRSIIRKGADFIAAMGFQLASTNLVIELGIIMFLLLGWQFTAAEFLGGILMVYIVAMLFRRLISNNFINQAKEMAELGVSGKTGGHVHAEMDASAIGPLTAISHYFMMDVMAIWKDVVLGLLIAGALSAWVPNHFWTAFFLQSHPTLSLFWGPLIGPIIAIFSFVCSVGNVPLAVVLWSGGISFGGVIAFIFADLIVLPILDIYRKYYGFKMMLVIFGIYYVAMALSALILECVFQFFKLIPLQRNISLAEISIHFNYTTVLNILFGIIALLLFYRFTKTKCHVNI